VLNNYKIYEVGGIKFSLTKREGIEFTTLISQMSNIPDLKSMVETDKNGFIVYFSPREISWSLVFFIQNLMIMQRLRVIDDMVNEKEEKND